MESGQIGSKSATILNVLWTHGRLTIAKAFRKRIAELSEDTPVENPDDNPEETGNPSDESRAEPAPPNQEIIERLEPYIQPGRATEAAKVVQAMLIQQNHSGPLPTAREFKIYESVVPGAGDRIIKMAETEQSHRHGIETKVISDDVKIKLRGQNFALISLILMLFVVVALAYLGNPVAGAGFGTAVIIGVIALFHGQRWFSKPESSNDQGSEN